MDKTLDFFINMFPWWMWTIMTVPFIIWAMNGFPRDVWDHGSGKALGWWAFWALGYLLYHINFHK